MKIVVGITGASGAVYGIRLLEVLNERAGERDRASERGSVEVETHLVVSATAKQIISLETDYELEEIYGLASQVHDNSNLTAGLSSGSVQYDGAVILPCSMKTLGCVAAGVSTTLITRVAEVCLKEGRRLVLVPRETPLSLVHLENMLRLKRAGAVLLPASPGFYHSPRTVVEVVDFVVARVLDILGIKNINLVKRWEPPAEKT
ncbi:MAG: UbiX family flavin prenyltransferase [Candidatus Methanospirareceae archaeon]|nr:UbiX family flavin prenyltransferase [Methanomicrobia archaeon]